MDKDRRATTSIEDCAIEIPISSNSNQENLHKDILALRNQQNHSEKEAVITECYKIYKLNMDDNRFYRKTFAVWSIALLTVMFLIIIGITLFHRPLSDNVVITLLSTTSLNLISLVAIVFRYLFSGHEKEFLIAHFDRKIQ